MAASLRIIICMLFSLCVACENSEKTSQNDAPVVSVFEVPQKELRLARVFSGRVVACNTAEIRPQISGIVLKRTFEEGAFVRADDILYEIDPAPYMAVLNKAAAREKNLDNLVKRQKTLLASRAVSKQDYEDTYYQWQQARAELDTARLDLRHCTIKAPLSGQAGKSGITMGALVVADQPQPMTTIHQLDPAYVDIFPAAAEAMQLLPEGRESIASVESILLLENATQYQRPGVIKFIDNHVREDTDTLGLRLEFANPDGRLLPGMFVRARLMEKTPKLHVILPQQAVFRDNRGKTQVWVVDGSNTVELRSVEVGQELGNIWIITEGLRPGERVITEGHLRVRPGMAVNPQAEEKVRIQLDFSDESAGGSAASDRPGE